VVVTHPPDRIRSAAADGLRKGVSGYVWLLKILLPIAFATALLDHVGWIRRLDFLLEPAMQWLGLPAAAALPIVIGALTGVYGCIAAMAVLSLSQAHMTVVAVFVLIAHNLPQEGIIQAKSGIPFVKTTLVRLAAAAATSMVVGWCLDAGSSIPETAVAAVETPGFTVFLKGWAAGMAWLCLQIFVILCAIMILIELLKAFHLVDALVRLLAPLLRLMGLDRQTGVLWLTGVILGLSYGGAVIVQQVRELNLTAEEVEKLQLSIGINHSMIEDPLVFLPLGLNPLWMWVPRLLAAVLAVYLAAGWFRLRKALWPGAG
jgi:Fe2+ transport system protein B